MLRLKAQPRRHHRVLDATVFYSEEQETKLSQDLLDFTTKAFSRASTKEKWKELTASYPQIKDTESLLVAPTMEAGMKEDIKKRHEYTKTKEVFAFDDGLAERQAAFIVVARPILAALSALDSVGGEDDAEAVDPDEIKDLLEDALVLLGNANFRLNAWRQKRFSEFLTEVGKRTSFQTNFMPKLRVSMTTARLTANSSAPHQQSASLNNPIDGISPCVQSTAPLITADLEGSGNGGLAQNLVTNPPNVAKKMTPPTSSLVTKPVRDDYPLPVLETLSPPNHKSAARLQYSVLNWKKLTEDPWTLQTIQGYKIPLYRRPRQWRTRITRAKSSMEAQQMDRAISNLLAKGAVKAVQPQDNQFPSTLFLVEKNNGEFRPVINLRALNRFLGKESFKMEGLQVVRSLLQKGDFMMKLDLKDAYYAIPIHPSHRKYLRFVYQNRVYEFQCLPFGLSSAPGAFTKTLKPVLAVLRSLGIRIVIYVDDMLLLHQQSKVLQRMFAQVVGFLEKLGFLVNIEKCSVTPSQCIVFLGAKLDSTTITISLPQPKLSTVLDTCQVLLAQGCVPMRALSTLIGRMSHGSQTGIMMAPLYYRGLQRLHLQTVAQHGHGSRVFDPLNYQALADLKWWVSESEHLNGCPVQQPPIDATIWSDASKKGWGAAYQGISTGGHWSVEEAKAHINVVELGAATFALKALLKHQLPVPKHVHLRLDNTTAVAYINKLGGHTLPCSDYSGTRTVGSSPGSRYIRDSSAYSRD